MFYKDGECNICFGKVGNKKASLTHSSDSKKDYEVWNRGLHTDINFMSENIESGEKEMKHTSLIMELYYYLAGELPKKEFEGDIEKIHFVKIGDYMKK